MADLVVFPDPVVRCKQYLERFTDSPVSTSLPDGYQGRTEHIVVEDTGGAGRREWAFSDRSLVIQIWGANRGETSATAHLLAGALHHWPILEDDVYMRDPDRDVGEPQWYVDDTRIPRYIVTVNPTFRGETVEISPAY